MTLEQYIQQKNLDISIVDLQELSHDSRLDSEYYERVFVYTDRKIKEKNYFELLNLTSRIFRNPMCYGFSYVKNGYPLIRIDDLHNPFINLEETAHIDKETNDRFSSTKLKHNDIVMGVRGNTIGRLGVYKGLDGEANISPNCIFFRLKDSSLADYISVFLIGNFGINQINRITTGTGQPTITSLLIKEIKVPIPSNSFQTQIANLIQDSYKQKELSKKLYLEAEKLLLSELGLENYIPTEQNISIKDSEEVELFGRVDAEFFQAKYDEIIEKIKDYKGGYDILENLITISNSKIKKEYDKTFKYIELADINASLGVVNVENDILSQDLPSRAQMKIQNGDILVSSLAGSADKVAIIINEDKNLVASTGFFVLRSKFFNSQTNLILMKSWIYKDMLIRSARGMIMEATNKEDFSKFILPKIDIKIQEKIAKFVKESHIALDLSKKLLEKAKKSVEIFIEEDEKKAGEFLE